MGVEFGGKSNVYVGISRLNVCPKTHKGVKLQHGGFFFFLYPHILKDLNVGPCILTTGTSGVGNVDR